MARAMNYQKKLEDLRDKIAKKQGEIKRLQAQMKELQEQQDKGQIDVLLAAIQNKGYAVADILEWVNNAEPKR